ncbi:ATP-dependent helicase [Leucobacter sp. MMO-57]|uniref:ATP-dependent helicase n=1 Tax=Leucobacter sp. MMO-57 TaxID=3081264 RepID=UPI003018EC2F
MSPQPHTHPEGGEPVVPVFAPLRIAELLAGPDGQVLAPTAEQRGVIEHPLAGSALVIAGAGSGKTETMANRVVWLVANGVVAPEQILGLTFTRKAAGELGERISRRLAGFSAALDDAEERGLLAPPESARAAALREQLSDGLDLPSVSTYHSFAASVVQEFGASAGLASDAALIDEASAWRIAREVVLASDDPDLLDDDRSVAQLVSQVLRMDHEVADHLTSLERVDLVIDEFARVVELPYSEKEVGKPPSGKVYAPVRDAVADVRSTALITRLARAYAEEKRRRGLMEFSDQLALAVRILDAAPDAVTALRRRSRAVLLDEVQDTSVGQTRLLSRIFAGLPVMAVGDPHQSIYGWRGASAEGLESFHRDFRGAGPERAATLTLSTSWRNPELVLRAANVLAGPLRSEAAIDVPELAPRPGAQEGTLEVAYPETLHEEQAALADWMRDARSAHREATGEWPTAAIVCRNRRVMPALASALSDRGVPNRIVGVGGLLTTPEVTDLVSTLRCLWFADAGSELVRLLGGPRFRVGVADLGGLVRAARWFAERDVAHQRIDDADRSTGGVLPDPDQAFTTIDAVDEIAGLASLDHTALKDISPTGRQRIREAGIMLRQLRQLVGGAIPELLRAVEQALRLDIELDAHAARGHDGAASARANLDAFADAVDAFLAVDRDGTLPSLLAWLELATEDDAAAEHVPEPEPGTVQLITVHGSKGLEWDLVAIPRLVDQEFPGRGRDSKGWLRPGQLPDELRGDAAARPDLAWRIASTQQDVRDGITGYREALAERFAAEERRLAYVAVTRAAKRLFLSGSFWGGQTRARGASTYLIELADAGLIPAIAAESAHESDPSASEETVLEWPLDPLGARADAVRRAARAVEARLSEGGASEGGGAPVDPIVELLLAERERARSALSARAAGTDAAAGTDSAAGTDAAADADDRSGDDAEFGAGVGAGRAATVERITASTFHEFVDEPEAAERARLRPVPQRPYRRTRVGNRFHEWVERRSSTAVGTRLTLPGFGDGAFVVEPGESGVIDATGFEESGEFSDSFGAPELPDAEVAFGASGVIGEPVESAVGPVAGHDDEERALQQLIANFERSEWAELQPIAVEQEISLPFAGNRLVCKLDAVFRHGDRVEIVDWKTGRAPRDDAERETRFYQLALYRHAWASWTGTPLDRIDATLYYVADDVILRDEHPLGLDELERRWFTARRSLEARLD